MQMPFGAFFLDILYLSKALKYKNSHKNTPYTHIFYTNKKESSFYTYIFEKYFEIFFILFYHWDTFKEIIGLNGVKIYQSKKFSLRLS